MHVDQKNIHNLKSLWRRYGYKKISNMPALTNAYEGAALLSMHWPHRVWVNDDENIDDLSALETTSKSVVFPVFFTENDPQNQLINNQLESAGWHCSFEQTAMYLTVSDEGFDSTYSSRLDFVVAPLKTSTDITQWIEIVYQAFGYRIDYAVIENLINELDIKILMAYYQKKPVATAILFKTGDVIGIHQMGVAPAFQGQGFARSLMQELMVMSKTWQGKQIVLQASQSGRPLYESLGFKSQFMINNYQRC